MSLRKEDFIIGCEQCKCGTRDGRGGFVVTVPLRDNVSGLEGTAVLKCAVSPKRHSVELEQWLDDDSHSIRPSAAVEKRLLQAIDYVADKRVCGNRHICPPDVVRTVEEQNRN